MQKLIEFNENQDTPLYRSSHLQELRHRSEYFEVHDLDTRVPRHDNPHYWLQRDILQIKNFQYSFLNNSILTDDTIPQVKMFTHFLLKFFRFNYQLIWEQKNQQAHINFPQILTPTELLPYIIKNENKHLQYRDLTSFNVTHFEQINLDHNFLVEYSETSDNRPFTTSNTSPEITPEEQTSNVNFFTLDNIQNNQNKKTLLTFFRTRILIKNTRYIHHYPKFPIYNKQILLKHLQFKLHKKSLKKLYKIHEVLQ